MKDFDSRMMKYLMLAACLAMGVSAKIYLIETAEV